MKVQIINVGLYRGHHIEIKNLYGTHSIDDKEIKQVILLSEDIFDTSQESIQQLESNQVMDYLQNQNIV